MRKEIKNIGIFAHVDAGKTTLTEQLLFHSNTIRTLGKVDDGNTVTDQMSLERERGISIQSTPVSFDYKDVKVNIIDTPGHVDFVAEVERSMLALDGAVLVVSAKEGVQSHTRLLYRTLKKRQVPTLIVVNKIDRMGVDIEAVLDEIKGNLSEQLFCVNYPNVIESRDASIKRCLLTMDDEQMDDIVMSIEPLMVEYLENNKLEEYRIKDVLLSEVRKSNWHPLCFASAMHGVGIDEILDSIVTWLPSFATKHHHQSGIVFKVKRNHVKTKEVMVKLTGGSIKYKGMLGDDKITSIKRFTKGSTEYVGELFPGDIAVLTGAHALSTGDVFGDQPPVVAPNITKATLQVSIKAQRATERVKLLDALEVLTEEDPYVTYLINELNQSISMQICGLVQLEIIKETLKRRFNVDIEFSVPKPIYYERVNASSSATMGITERSPFYAGIGFSIRANGLMEGTTFRSEISNGFLRQPYQNAVKDGAFAHLSQGLKGWEIVDLDITFDDFSYDSVMSTPKDYRELAPLVVFEAIKKVGTHLLWPLYNFTLILPIEHLGRGLRDVSRMCGVYQEPELTESMAIITGKIPVEKCMDYHVELMNYTSGLGVFETSYGGYEKAPDGVEAQRDFFKVDPANKGNYILNNRNVR